MLRRPRLTLAHMPVHLTVHLNQRSNYRQACFVAEEDYQRYLDWFKQCADRVACRVHAYVRMSHHVSGQPRKLTEIELGELLSQ